MEEIKKDTTTTTKKATKPRKKKPVGRGGKRKGAGRKKGVAVGPYGPRTENPKTKMLPFRVSEITSERIKQLRELTKYDTMPFVDMLEDWVRELAEDYGIQ